MNRNTFTEMIGEELYTFSERNREDVNYTKLQNAVRRAKIDFIKEEFKDNEELLIGFLGNELNKEYSEREVSRYVFDNTDEMARLCYASFKIEHGDVSLEDFKKLVMDNKVSYESLLKKINQVEGEVALDADVTKGLKIDHKKFVSWKDEHPEVYWAIKKAYKKKVIQKQ